MAWETLKRALLEEIATIIAHRADGDAGSDASSDACSDGSDACSDGR
jgi:hypothetical protein